MKSDRQSILCVEDDRDNLELLAFLFKSHDFDVTACDNLEDGLTELKKRRFSAIILDNRFGQRSGIEFCDDIRRHDLQVPIIFYSGEARASERAKAMEACADAYLVKPHDFHKLTDTVKSLIRESRTE